MVDIIRHSSLDAMKRGREQLADAGRLSIGKTEVRAGGKIKKVAEEPDRSLFEIAFLLQPIFFYRSLLFNPAKLSC